MESKEKEDISRRSTLPRMSRSARYPSPEK
jgi:hypothetical protein